MIDDLLYGKIAGPEGSVRRETKEITENISVEYEVTVKDGQEQAVIKTITITSRGQHKVVVDDKTIVEPAPPPVYDDACYY